MQKYKKTFIQPTVCVIVMSIQWIDLDYFNKKITGRCVIFPIMTDHPVDRSMRSYF